MLLKHQYRGAAPKARRWRMYTMLACQRRASWPRLIHLVAGGTYGRGVMA